MDPLKDAAERALADFCTGTAERQVLRAVLAWDGGYYWPVYEAARREIDAGRLAGWEVERLLVRIGFATDEAVVRTRLADLAARRR